MRQLGQIDGNLNLTVGRAPIAGLLDAGDGIDLVTQAVGELFQPPHRQDITDQSRLEERDLIGADLADLKHGKALGQGGAQGIGLADHLIIFSVRLDVPIELDNNHRAAIKAGRPDLTDIIQPAQRIFQRFSNELFHLRRGRAGQGGPNRHQGKGKLGVFRA